MAVDHCSSLKFLLLRLWVCSNPVQSTCDGSWDGQGLWWYWQMGTLGLEAILVSHVAQLNWGTVWGRVLVGSLHFLGFGVLVAGVLQHALLGDDDAVSALEGGAVRTVGVHL